MVVRAFRRDEILMVDPVTGSSWPLRRQSVTLFDPHTGGVAIFNREPALQCRFGDMIESGQTMAFCRTCGFPTCPRHSITCLCGSIFCTECTQLLAMNGVTLRVCPDCYRALRERFWQKMIRILFGRKRS